MQNLGEGPFPFPTACFREKATDGLRTSIMRASSLYDKIGKCQQIILGKTKENREKQNKTGENALKDYVNKLILRVRCGETLVIMGEKSCKNWNGGVLKKI